MTIDEIDPRSPRMRFPRPLATPITREALLDIYSRFRPGLTPSEEELTSHLGNPGGIRGVMDTLVNSDEGRARGTTLADIAAPGGMTGAAIRRAGLRWDRALPGVNTGTTVEDVASGRRGWASATGTGLALDAPAFGNSGAMWGGFNEDRALAGGDPNSVKDAFYRWTYGLNFNPAGKSKADIETFLRSQLDSAKAAGLNILDVDGEQILIETKERGPEWVDVVEKAGDPNARWQWLTQLEFGRKAPADVATRTLDPNRHQPMTLPGATTNPDGTVSIRVSPEIYRRIEDLQLRRRRRTRVEDVVPTPEVVP